MSELVGWRSVAKYIGVSPRTAQRYEVSLALPVRRGKFADEVHATREELDRWLEETATRRAVTSTHEVEAAQAVGLPAAGSPTTSDSDPPSRRRAVVWRPDIGGRDAAWAGLVLLAGVAAAFSQRGPVAVPRAIPMAASQSPDSLIVGDRRGQLVGRIAVDVNGNGEWDAGELFASEPGRACPNARTVPGIIVRWEGVGRGSSAPLNCNPEPFYHANLEPGRYRVTVVLPHGWVATSPASADVDVETSRDTHLWFTITQKP